jgi:glycosyltransferase involved in cell wall biosynthesis
MPRYAEQLASACQGAGWEFERFRLAPPAAELSRLPRRLRNLAHHSRICLAARSLGRRRDLDLLHVVDGSHGYLARLLPADRTVVTVHDVIPWLQWQGRFAAPAPGRAARWLIQNSLRGVRRAVAVAADSQSTANDLLAAGVSGDRVRVVHLALSPEFIPAPGETAGLPWKARRERPDALVLHVGNNGFYKNRDGVLRIFSQLQSRSPVRLCLAGPPPHAGLLQVIEERGLSSVVDVVVHPTDAQLRALYARAALLLFPSIYEGFGWPPLEAMAWGCPVVASDGGSLREIVGDAGLVRAVDDEAGLAAAVSSVLDDPDVAARLVAAGLRRAAEFSVERLREEMRAFYAAALGSACAAERR